MARNTQFFNQALATVILDGVVAEGYMDGDAIRVNESTEGSTIERGLDGATTTFSTDQAGTLELDLKGTSPTLDILRELWRAQKTANAREFDAQVVTSANEMIRCEGCSVASMGNTATGGRTASARTVVINVRRITA